MAACNKNTFCAACGPEIFSPCVDHIFRYDLSIEDLCVGKIQTQTRCWLCKFIIWKNQIPHCVILVWVWISRGQCVAVWFIQSERSCFEDAWKSFLTVCGQVESGLPGSAIILGPLYNKVTGTRTLQEDEWRFQSSNSEITKNVKKTKKPQNTDDVP